MLDLIKFYKYSRISIIIIAILVLLSVIGLTYARFETDGNGSINASVAFYVLDVGTETKSIRLTDIKPDDNEYTYNIFVQNKKDNKLSEVDMKYDIYLKTTTNIPAEYKIYKNNSSSNSVVTVEQIEDEDGMFFKKYLLPSDSFKQGVYEKDTYKLVVKLPSSYKEHKYQGLVESIDVVVESNQM